MADNDQCGHDGDPQTDPDAALLDHQLRQLLTDFPDASDIGGALPLGAADEISRAIGRAWPDGQPPTPEELAGEDDAYDTYLNDSALQPHRYQAAHDNHYARHTELGNHRPEHG
jgi:hypothetical protein